MESISERFAQIDSKALWEMGTPLADKILNDINDRSLSIKEIAERNGVNMSDVMQVARFSKIDPITLEPYE
jgi:hypothetical protein